MSRHHRQRATRFHRAPVLCLFITCFFLALPSATQAQAVDIDQQIQRLGQQLQTLDDQAQACLTALDTEPPADNPLSISQCQAFMNAIDGEPVANYLAACRQLELWRKEYVDRHATARTVAQSSTTAAEADSERDLQRLVDIEYYCGDDALRLRTNHVFDAFAMVRRSRVAGQGLAGTRPGLSAPHSENIGTVRAIHERLRLETEQRWQQLQLDLLRQQSQQPVDYGLIR